MQYNLDNGYINYKKIEMRTTTIVDILYADDCVLFNNTIRAMLGMKLTIAKTKVVCNQFSKAMEIKAQGLEEQLVSIQEAVGNSQGYRLMMLSCSSP